MIRDKTLTISDRKGSFAGMKERMDFNIVIVTPESGTGIYQSKVNKSIVYEGKINGDITVVFLEAMIWKYLKI